MMIRFESKMHVVQALVAVLGMAALSGTWAEQRPVPIQRTEAMLKHERSVQKIKGLKASPGELRTTADLQANVIHDYSRPPNWPATRSWKPLRHFGPFFSGSNLDKIQVHVVRQGTVNIVYNDFLTAHPDADVFKKYYGQQLPGTPTPAPDHVPGTFPTQAGPNDILFQLDQIRYTSRYGGSVQLLFKMNEDFEGEIVQLIGPPGPNERIVWDLKSLLMSVYVIPSPQSFNPLSASGVPQPSYIEFEPADAVAYKVDGSTRTPISEDMSQQLREALDAMKPWASQALRTDMHDLVHGFVHSQFRDDIAATELVDRVEITDGFLALYTREAIPVFEVQMRIRDVALNTESGPEEIGFEAGAWHVYDPAHAAVDPPPADTPMARREFPVINNGQGTPYQTFGVFRVNDCSRLALVRFWFAAEEEDGFPNPSDYYRNYVHPTVHFDCGNLAALATAAAYGVVSEATVEGMDLLRMETLVREGYFSFTTRVVLSRM